MYVQSKKNITLVAAIVNNKVSYNSMFTDYFYTVRIITDNFRYKGL